MFERIVTALDSYSVVLEPDENLPEWWAGAPSVLLDDDGTFYMATRMREGNSPRGKRGYENRILRSADGRNFETINQLHRDKVGIPGFERPSLVKDPVSGRYRLYSCSGLDGNWGIIKFVDADHPSEIDPTAWEVVLQPEVERDDRLGFIQVEGYKDPFVFHDGKRWHMFVIGYDRIERPYHFVSDDGLAWESVPADGQVADRALASDLRRSAPAYSAPIMENDGWHNVFTRPACVLPMTVGYLLVYEGSSVHWRDPSYNIATGLAYTPDLETYVDMTPDAPILMSTTPGDYHTWRYSHWLLVGSQIFVYFEASRPNNSNEIRLGVFDAEWVR